LRKFYVDPISGKPEWGTVLSADGRGIIGIHSLSTGTPIKIANFPPELTGLEGRHTYSEWVFGVDPVIKR
jgi:hypothetical protein